MPGNTFGRIFSVTNWGESHGKAIGVVVDGCPPLIELSEKDIQKELDRRKPGQSDLTTTRNENDTVEILSGVFDGKTTGTPISMIIQNNDVRRDDYRDDYKMVGIRPGHADFTYEKKYGIRDPFGGGRSSGRLTAGTVAAGAIAKKILSERAGVEVVAYVKRVKDVEADVDTDKVALKDVESNSVRCPDKKAAEKMKAAIEDAKKKKDSVGGIIECVARNVPAGLGEPIFDRLDADLAKGMLAINASKGFEFGSGFSCAGMVGSEHNDIFTKDWKTKTNNAGGILGGISNGMPIVFRVAFKPTATIGKERHDPCVLPRAVPVVEAMAALVLCDHLLRHRAQCGDKNGN
ncbi:chorismate synthase [Candidatus Woesearchaeota archaeon CG_4_10_14_0_8_um_filter_47_5]|nr:MAG: chorismate synthase [Candidatus Woesearchaeota archaeon CG_4_10_14_0_8_um_filter_47_5]